MISIRGIYDGKNIIPLEHYAIDDNDVEVIITFLERERISEDIPSENHYVSEAEFLEMTNEDTHWELRYGELIKHTPQRIYHSRLSNKLFRLLDSFVLSKGIGEIHSAPTAIKLADNLIYEPDVFFLTTEQANKLDSQDFYFVGVPKLIIEIVSPSSRRRDTHIKFLDYEHFGVEEYWLIDPLEKKYNFYHLAKKHYELIAVDNDIFKSIVLDGFEIKLRDLEIRLE